MVTLRNKYHCVACGEMWAELYDDEQGEPCVNCGRWTEPHEAEQIDEEAYDHA